MNHQTSLMQKSTVPRNGFTQTLIERVERTPPENLSRLPCTQVLTPDLVVRFVADVGFEVAAHLIQYALDKIEHRDLEFVREIESFAAKFRAFRQGRGQGHISCRTVFRIEIIANVVAVGADDGGHF